MMKTEVSINGIILGKVQICIANLLLNLYGKNLKPMIVIS